MINTTNYFQNTYGKFRCIKKLPANVIQLDSLSKDSKYYISSDGETLYRVSNHWSLSECPFIASCVWILLDTKGKKNIGTFRIGAIKFKDLKNIRDIKLTTRIGYYSGKEIIDDRNVDNYNIVEKVLNMRMTKR